MALFRLVAAWASHKPRLRIARFRPKMHIEFRADSILLPLLLSAAIPDESRIRMRRFLRKFSDPDVAV
jgi:hypothetical protein